MDSNGGKQKEIDRIIHIVEKMATIDAKLEAFCKQYAIDVNMLKDFASEHAKIYEQIAELRKEIEDNQDSINKNTLILDKNQWRFGAILIFISSSITTLIVIGLHALLGF